MAQPLVSWWQRDNSAQWTSWDIGVVDAGTVSNDFGFLIWNNRRQAGSTNPETSQEYGATPVADMEDATITTKDELGNNTGALVEGQWIEVKVDSISEATFVPIGYDTTAGESVKHTVKTTGTTIDPVNGSIVSTPGDTNHTSTLGTTCILGVANDGIKANSAGNFVELTLHARVPGIATAGLINFYTRVSYKYV